MVSSFNRNSEFLWYRVILGVGAIALPLYGLIVKSISPDSIDFMSHRLVIAGTWLLTLVLSYFNTYVKDRLVSITCWLMLALHLWVIWIVYVNRFSVDYFIGYLTSFCALNLTVRRPVLFYSFIVTAIALTIFAAWLVPEPEIHLVLIAFAVTIVGIVFMVIAGSIINYQKELSELNLTLERKVEERTAVAENRAKQLAVKNRELEQFAYVASHDLKSPLRNIGGFVQLIQRKLKNLPDGDLQEYLGFVVKGVNKMNAIIDDVLLYSRFGDETTTFEKADITSILKEACILLDREIKMKNASVLLDIGRAELACDRKQVEQLFRNLLENGLKYNTSAQPVIEITMRERKTEYLFAVKDNGIGIPSEHQEKIFKMFQRLHTDQEYSGTGIGLAICKRIVENHQGKIWIHSQPGEGATFFFTFSKNLVATTRQKEVAGTLN